MKHNRTIGHLVWFAAIVMAWSVAAFAEPLNPPIIQDMIILGQYANNSADAYDIVKEGDYLYTVGYPGLDTVRIYEDVGQPGVKQLQWTAAHDNGSKMNGAAVSGAYLYVGNWAPWNGLRTFSLADPAVPADQGHRSSTYHTWEVEAFDSVLFVTEGVSGPGGIRVYDITNPQSPVHTKTVSPSGGGSHITNAVLFGDYMYFCMSNRLYVYNAVDPYNPTYRWKNETEIEALCSRVKVADGFLYVLGVDEDYHSWYKGGLYAFSLDNPAMPANVKGPGGGPVYDQYSGGSDLHLQGRYLAATWGGQRIVVFDVSDPYNIAPLPGYPRNLLWDDDGDGTASNNPPDFHDGYPNCIAGAGNHIYVGTTMDGGPDGSDPLFGSRIYAVQIAEGESEEQLTEVSIDLGSPDVEEGLIHPKGGDGDTEPVSKGGRLCRQNVDTGEDFYFMFKVSDSFAYAGSRPDLYIAIDYFDEGTGSLTLHYDSPGEQTSDKYKDGGSVTLTDTGTWKHHVFHVTDAWFANRQNFDADFRIFGGVGNRMYLDMVYVAETPPVADLSVSLATLDRTVVHGLDLPNDGFLVTNSGTARLFYSISDDADWLEVTPVSGEVDQDAHAVTITYDTSALATGLHQAQISTSDPNASNSPRVISVNVTVEPAGDLEGDNDVDQADFGLLQACLSGSGVLLANGCEGADIDGDQDVDQFDFSLLQGCMGGEDNPPGC